MITLVVGLGNPGMDYERTRHNIGFDVAALLATRRHAYWRRESKWNSELAETNFAPIDGPRVRAWIMRPLTFMNLSGEAVRAVLNWNKLGPDSLLVISDDVSLPLGTMRLRPHGGHGGHNGLRSIIASLNTDKFARLRVGVGSAGDGRDLSNYVLGKFTESEQPLVHSVLDRAAQAVESACTLGLAMAMNQYNRPALDADDDSDLQ